mgnify:CR=1 FL=1
MNLRDLKYLIAVADSRHFGHAAERCFVSQPTLSGQIRKLEQELGVTLFERSNRSVQITPVGQDILQHAHLIIEQADAIQQLARSQRDPLAGPLRLGVIPTLSPYLMPLVEIVLRRFSNEGAGRKWLADVAYDARLVVDAMQHPVTNGHFTPHDTEKGPAHGARRFFSPQEKAYVPMGQAARRCLWTEHG